MTELVVGPDEFAYSATGPDAGFQQLINGFLAEFPYGLRDIRRFLDSEIGQKFAALSPRDVCRLFTLLTERTLACLELWNGADLFRALMDIFGALRRPNLPFRDHELQTLLSWFQKVDKRIGIGGALLNTFEAIVQALETDATGSLLSNETRQLLGETMASLERVPNLANRDLLARCQKLIPERPALTDEAVDAWLSHEFSKLVKVRNGYPIDPSTFEDLLSELEHLGATASISKKLKEAVLEVFYQSDNRKWLARCWAAMPAEVPLMATDVWTSHALNDLEELSAAQRQAWIALLTHCGTATASKPTPKWLKTAGMLVQDIGVDGLRQHLFAWLPLTAKPRQGFRFRGWYIHELELDNTNEDVLRGLVWCASFLDGAELPGVLASLAIASYRKIQVTGPRAVKIGNAALWVLGNLPGLDGAGALSVLKTRVKFATAQKLIDAALTQVAERERLPREEIEELAVPGYGMESVGLRTEPLGGFTAELRVLEGGATELLWRAADGKLQKSVPAAVKAEHSDDLKDIKQAAQDIQKQLPAQKERLDRLFIQEKSWSYPVWRERYLDHPLVGILARRLIWCFSGDGGSRQGIFDQDTLRDRDGQVLAGLDERTQVTLWHPLNSAPAEVLAWRVWLEQQHVSQPLKQAHREIYLLTDAERTTGTYSNRFAAHILKQHQFNALCAARGWRNRLHMAMDEDHPGAARRELPQWNLRAEYWVEGVGAEYGIDTNDAGAFLHVATDQVRFYTLQPSQSSQEDQPLSLDQVPPRVFSEVMRDVDLFVGVAGVGNDPAWVDNQRDASRDYWQRYAFGDLSESAKTRHDVLARLLPRMKIAGRCTLEPRFLEVRGDIRNYRIHLGSGNIMMSPNDQYLCIVAAQGKAGEKVFLPFEGDGMLSVILSKAFLLAADKNITDPAILAQIRH